MYKRQGQIFRHGEELLPELRADDAALLLRIGHAAQKLQVCLLYTSNYLASSNTTASPSSDLWSIAKIGFVLSTPGETQIALLR